MDAFNLHFHDAGAEKLFQAEHAGRKARLDAFALVLYAVLLAPGTLTLCAWRLGVASFTRTRFMAACERLGFTEPLVVLGLLLAACCAPRLYAAQRTRILLASRLLLLVFTAHKGYAQCPAASRWWDASEPPPPESQFSAFAWRSGLIAMLWHSLALPLPFATHMLVQGLYLATYILALAPAVCHGMHDIQGVEHTLAWARRIAAVAKGLSGGVAARLPHGGAAAAAELGQVCVLFVAHLQIAAGFVLPSAVRYASELHERRCWQHRQLLDAHSLAGERGEPPLPPRWRDAWARCAAGVAAACVLWVQLHLLATAAGAGQLR